MLKSSKFSLPRAALDSLVRDILKYTACHSREVETIHGNELSAMIVAFLEDSWAGLKASNHSRAGKENPVDSTARTFLGRCLTEIGSPRSGSPLMCNFRSEFQSDFSAVMLLHLLQPTQPSLSYISAESWAGIVSATCVITSSLEVWRSRALTQSLFHTVWIFLLMCLRLWSGE